MTGNAFLCPSFSVGLLWMDYDNFPKSLAFRIKPILT